MDLEATQVEIDGVTHLAYNGLTDREILISDTIVNVYDYNV